MTEQQKADRAAKARARVQAWRDRVKADPERLEAERARHAARCAESRARARAARPPKPAPEKHPQAERLAAKRAYYARWMAKPGVREEQTDKARRRRAKNLDAVNARRRELRASRRTESPAYRLRARPAVETRRPFAGSVLNASAASPGRDVLAEVTALVPHWMLSRDDIIGEALLMTLEGLPLHDAVKAARTKVARDTRHMLQSVQVEACTWL